MFYDDYKPGHNKFKKINFLDLWHKYSKKHKYNMKINEAIDILTDYGYVVDNIPTDTVHLDLEPKETKNVEAYDIDINNPICPCCGKRLNIVNTNVETDEFIGESTKLNERWENEFLTNKVQDIANQLFEEELADVQPEVDNNGNITNEYLERFQYNSPALKKAVKRAATKLSNDLGNSYSNKERNKITLAKNRFSSSSPYLIIRLQHS